MILGPPCIECGFLLQCWQYFHPENSRQELLNLRFAGFLHFLHHFLVFHRKKIVPSGETESAGVKWIQNSFSDRAAVAADRLPLIETPIYPTPLSVSHSLFFWDEPKQLFMFFFRSILGKRGEIGTKSLKNMHSDCRFTWIYGFFMLGP